MKEQRGSALAGNSIARRYRLYPLAACAAGIVAVIALCLGALSSSAAGETLGIDPQPDAANTSASLGPIETCRQVGVGEQFNVDLYIAGASGLQTYDAYVRYDSTVLQLDAFDTNFMLPDFSASADVGNGAIYFASALTAGANGSGVLARITFRATAQGFSNIVIDPVSPYAPTINNAPFSGFLGGATIAAGQPCSGAPTPSPTPTRAPTGTPTPTPAGTVGSSSSTPTPTPSPTFSPLNYFYWGDMDCSNGVTIDDAVFIAQAKAGLPPAPVGGACPSIGGIVQGSSFDGTWGDVNCNSQVELSDAIAIVRHLIGLPASAGPGCLLIATNLVYIPAGH